MEVKEKPTGIIRARSRPIHLGPVVLKEADEPRMSLEEVEREIAVAERNITVLREKTRMGDKYKQPSLKYQVQRLSQLKIMKSMLLEEAAKKK